MSHDSTIVDWPVGLPVPLLQRRHQHAPRSRGTQMDSRRIRMRREYEIDIQLMDVTWNFTVDQFETFRSFFKEALNNGSLPFEVDMLASVGSNPDELELASWVVSFWQSNYSFTRSDNLVHVVAMLEVAETARFSRAWDYTACEVVEIEDGGGDTFDCYPEGELPEALDQEPFGFEQVTLTGGNGFEGAWIHGDSPFIAKGDDFQSYAQENDPITQTLSGGTGFSGDWVHGDGP